MEPMEPTRFSSRPFFVKGFKVTEENIEAVAQWCEGAVVQTSQRKFIRVPVQNARSIRQTEANIGDWVLKSRKNKRNSFKVYDEPWLFENFFEAPKKDIEIDDEDDALPLDRTINKVESNVRPLPVQQAQGKNVRFGVI